MKITILASGSSGNSYHITDGTTEILIDAGISLQKIREGVDFKTTLISAVLISHHHL